jgi:NAD(P)-dependent dehydrogenase (short-subunit alcohol dehydrogenase family)
VSVHFEGRVALITGAGKSLGRAYALWLAAQGAAVVVNNRVHPGVPSSAQAVVDEIVAAGGRAIADGHSVEDAAGARAMVDAAYTAFGRLDILVCNAGISRVNRPFQSMSIDEIREVVDVNLWGTLLPLHAAFPRMVEAGYGRIVLTTSQVGLFGRAGSSAYACTKSAMIGLARAVGWDGHPHNVRVNVVAPGGLHGDVHAAAALQGNHCAGKGGPGGRLAVFRRLQ